MTLYVLDTDTSSYIIRQRPREVLERMQKNSAQGHIMTISAITYAELLLGAERSSARVKHLKLIEAFVERLDTVLPWDANAAENYAKTQAALLKNGAPIGTNDTMIAGHVLSVDGVVVTNNVKHFKKVAKLKVENWTLLS